MKKSSIQRLPKDVRDYLNEMLRGQYTQLEATDLVNDKLINLGLDVKISKSSVNRYAVKMNEVGKKIQQSREISQMWIDKLGSQPGGQMGNLLMEIVRTMIFETVQHISTREDMVDPEVLIKLSLAIHRLELASAENEKRERQIKQNMAKEVEKELGKKGFDADTLKTAVQAVYGIISN